MKIPENALFYLSNNGQDSVGPYPLMQVRSMWESGSITAAAQLCHDGETWIPALSLMGKLDAERSAEQKAKENAPSHAIYAILGIFLGMVGIHNFYAKQSGRAMVQIALTGFGLLFSGITGFAFLIIVAIWVLLEIINGPPSPSC